jgi:acetyl-CoA acetyltransferase family protein
MSERVAVIIDAVRTPIGKKNGSLANWRPDDLAAETIKALVQRNNLNPANIDDVMLGCVTQVQDQAWNIARNAALAAGLPISVPGTTINRLCASSLQACNFASQAVRSGDVNLVIAGGVESMTRVPMGSDAGTMSPRILDRFDLIGQGISAEMIAEKWGFSRQQLDEFSLGSHEKALRFNTKKLSPDSIARTPHELISVEVAPGTKFVSDEGPRVTNMEKMSRLQPVFKEGGVITAGNSSQISDGAAALLIVDGWYAMKNGMAPRAKIIATAAVGVDPTVMLTGPIPATRKALSKAGLEVNDIDLFECNEAFAPVVLAWMKELNIDESRVNVNGGAIALGHPLGCSGARLLTSMLYEMERRGSKYGLATMCIGMGQGVATIIERF